MCTAEFRFFFVSSLATESERILSPLHRLMKSHKSSFSSRRCFHTANIVFVRCWYESSPRACSFQALCGSAGVGPFLWHPGSPVRRFRWRPQRGGSLPAAVHHGRCPGRGAAEGPGAGGLHDQHLPHHAKVNDRLTTTPTRLSRHSLTDTVLLSSSRKLGTAGQRMGGAAALCHIRHDPVAPGEHSGCFTLTAANVGWCQGVLCRDGKAMQLSAVHTVTDEAERQRVRRHNAVITEVTAAPGL